MEDLKMIKNLHINVGACKVVQNLACVIAINMNIDVVAFSKKYRNSQVENKWYNDAGN